MDQNGHPVNSLFLRMQETFPDYPPAMVPVPFEIIDGAIDSIVKGTSFFPGGWGFRKSVDDELPKWPEHKVMVIGNDWGNEGGFSLARSVGHEANGSTWRGILDLFPQVFDNIQDCFFTNSFVGLREGKQSSVGACPGRQDPVFKQRCREFVAFQLSAQKPRLILTFGKWVPDMLSQLAPRLAPWKEDDEPTWQAIDSFGPIQHEVFFDVLPSQPVVVCALTHPDRGHLNHRHRNYGQYGSELGLLRGAVKAARLMDHGVVVSL